MGSLARRGACEPGERARSVRGPRISLVNRIPRSKGCMHELIPSRAMGRELAHTVRSSVTMQLSPEQRQILVEGGRLEPLCEVTSSAEAKAFKARLRKLPSQAKEENLVLYTSANMGNLVALLLSAGVSPNLQWQDGSVLAIAAAAGAAHCVRALLAGGADVNAVAFNGWSVLHCTSLHTAAAAEEGANSGQLQCARLLLEGGADVEAREPAGRTPLLLAAEGGQERLAALLLEAGASVSAVDSSGATALHLAASLAPTVSPALINMLLEAGADIEAKDKNGCTPLAMAAGAGRLGAIGRLLARGANANAASNVGATPLMMALRKGQLLAMRALLPRSDVSIVNKIGKNVLHVCAIRGNVEAFNLLFPCFNDLDVRTQVDKTEGERKFHHQSALHLACSAGQHALTKRLLQCGALRTAVDCNGSTPCFLASNNGNLSCLALLLGQPGAFRLTPAEVNVTSSGDYSPLHLAAGRGHLRVCGMLIQAGARLDAKTIADSTPLLFAQKKHPSNAPLHALLSGAWTGPLPGTVCERCDTVPDSALLHCSGCLSVRYCCPRCAMADWPRHAAYCMERREERAGMKK